MTVWGGAESGGDPEDGASVEYIGGVFFPWAFALLVRHRDKKITKTDIFEAKARLVDQCIVCLLGGRN